METIYFFLTSTPIIESMLLCDEVPNGGGMIYFFFSKSKDDGRNNCAVEGIKLSEGTCSAAVCSSYCRIVCFWDILLTTGDKK